MKDNAICILLIASLLACQGPGSKTSRGEWLQLFNGKDLDDWQVKIAGHALNDNYANTFRVIDGKLTVAYDGYSEFQEKFGHIFYKEKFSHYLLAVEYRFVGDQAIGGPGWAIRNSGVMLHSQAPETMLKDQDFPISVEVQFLGGNGTDKRPTANLCTPGTNVVIDGDLFTSHCISSQSKTYHGDHWVRVEVLVLGDSIMEHIIDGAIVLQYEKPQIGGGNVINYDSAIKKDGTLLREGYISLQSESHPIEFRKVELFDLQEYRRDPAGLKDALASLGVRNRIRPH